MCRAPGMVDQRCRPIRPPLLLVWCCALVLAAAGCTGGQPQPAATERPPAAGSVPDIPAADEDGGQATPEPTGAADVPSPRPRPGEHVLAALEGPLSDREATDVVLRTERGQELDRFRLPGAVDLHAEPGGRWALVATLTGQWARLDAQSQTLSLVPFPGSAPSSAPRLAGELATWEGPEATWLLRLDDGESRTAEDLLGEQATVVDVSADGTHVLLRGSRTVVVDTATWEVRETVQSDRIAMGADGTIGTVEARDGQAILAVQAPGEAIRDLAILPGLGQPVPLPGGRVAVLGGDSALVTPEGSATPLPTVAVDGRAVASPDGQVILVATADGLVAVDVDDAAVTTFPGTAGFVPVDRPATGWMWALSADGAGGAAVVDVANATASIVLEDVDTTVMTSATADGSIVAISSGADGGQTVVVRADGSTVATPGGGDVVEVALNPDGEAAAFAVVDSGARSVLVGEVDAPEVTVDTGRQPVWLRTDES